MIPYWLMLSVPVLALVWGRRLKQEDSVIMIYIAGLLIAFLVGLRHEVGADWYGYFRYLDAGSRFTLSENLLMGDPGYRFINWLANHLGFYIYFVNLMCGIFLMLGVISFSRRQPLPWLALYIAIPYLIIVVGMGYTRQAAALGFAMLGMACLHDLKLRQFIFWVIIGATFHKSAVLLLPLAALSTNQNRIFSILWISLLFFLVLYLFVLDSLEALWGQYVEQKMESQGALIRVVMNALPAVIYIFFHSKFHAPDTVKKFWFWISLASIVFLPLVMLASTATDRIALYFIPIQMFVFSRLHNFSALKERRAIIVACIMGGYAGVLAVWLLFAGHSYAWLPYRILGM